MQKNPCAVLLAVQLAGILLYPYLDDAPGSPGQVALAVFGIVVLVQAVQVVMASPIMTWLGWLIGAPTIVLTLVDAFPGMQQPLHLVSDIFHALFYLYTFIGLVIYMFADMSVSVDEMFAVGATFTVGVWLFAYIYSIIQTVVPGSFQAAGPGGAQHTWMELLFLSCTTMTSTGLSDIIPVKPHARSFVMIQQIVGMLYVAMVVARIVALTANRAIETMRSKMAVKQAGEEAAADQRILGGGGEL